MNDEHIEEKFSNHKAIAELVDVLGMHGIQPGMVKEALMLVYKHGWIDSEYELKIEQLREMA